MSFTRGLVCLILAASSCFLYAQNPITANPAAAQPASAPGSVSATLSPALSEIGRALDNIDIRRWKAPNPVRSVAEDNVSSIQRDLSGTLAALLRRADAAPGSAPPAFAVYRNVDALYDTLLRVVETADLAAPAEEASPLQEALGSLESARSTLGDQILNAFQTQQAELIRLRGIITATASAPPKVPVQTIVINDGPAPEKPAPTTRRRHVTHKASHSAKKTSKPAENSDQHPQ